MGYRILDLSKRPSRLTEAIGVSGKAVRFNSLIRRKMGITKESKLAFLVSDDGFLAINVLGKDSPTGKALSTTGSAFIFHSAKLMKSIAPGRYHITGRDGAFWLTDIKYEEK